MVDVTKIGSMVMVAVAGLGRRDPGYSAFPCTLSLQSTIDTRSVVLEACSCHLLDNTKTKKDAENLEEN